MSNVPPDLKARIAAIKAAMTGGAAEGGAAAAGGAPSAAPAGGEAAAPGDVAARIAAIKAKMSGGASGGAAPAAGAAAKAAPAAAAKADGGDMQARVAALKAKMEAGKAQAPGAAKPAAAAAAKPAAPAGKPIFPVKPINRTGFGGENLYGPFTLSRWFTISALALAAMVVVMINHDYQRDWKGIQREFREMKIAAAKAELAAAEAALGEADLPALEAAVAQAAEAVAARADEIAPLQARLAELEGEYYRNDQNFQFAKSEFDAARYLFEDQRLLHGGDAALMASSREHLAALQSDMEAKQALADGNAVELEALKERIAEKLAERTTAEKALAAATESRDLIAARLAKIDHGIFNDFIRNAPIADMLAPTLKVDQIVLEKLTDNYNFMYVGKVDRCTTCHVAIDDPKFIKPEWTAPDEEGSRHKRVFQAHPRLDLFVADDSPHPKGEFGCTVCHLGRGQAVEFPRTFHVPTADAHETVAQKTERWVKEYGYDVHRHYWDWPMTPSDKLYSSCNQCHSGTDRIAGVPEYNESRELVETLGCYGCHKIEGFEHLRKVGPDLTHLAAKTTEQWTRKWLIDPKGFRPTTRMPHFWNQSNTGGPMATDLPYENNSDRWVADWRARNEVEARAVAAYIFGQSREVLAQPDAYAAGPAPKSIGDAGRGRELFEQRGCLGCHSLERAGQVGEDHGPDLSAIGSKVSAAWLHDWLQNPRHYFETTVMPDLRLPADESWDITAYLMEGKDPAWEARPDLRADEQVLDAIAVEYIAPTSSEELARAQVASWRAEGGRERVEQFVGGKLFARNGCSGCHLVPGHYDDMGVGTELTKEALKEVAKFDFGFEASVHNPLAIPHTRHDWFRAKLRDPRVFDRMPVIEGKHDDARVTRWEQKVKAPGDKLKMPNFNLTDAETELVVQFLMGLRADGIDPTMKRNLTADEQVLEQASRLMTERNCMGCHQIGQLARPLGELDEDALYANHWMAAPVTVGKREVLALNAWLQDEIYDPWEEEDADTLEFFEEHRPDAPLLVYGKDEGGIGAYIDEAAMRPPVLRGEGEKVHPDWLFEFLLAPYIVRTHLEVRMPSFGFTEDESMALARWFAAQAGQPWPFEVDADATPDPKLLAAGAARFEKLQCNSCHPAGGVNPSNPDSSNWGPDLGIAAERLKGAWVHDWLKNPQASQPGTKMPSFFGELKDGEYKAFVEDWEQQVRELQHYLRHMGAAGAGTAVSMGDK